MNNFPSKAIITVKIELAEDPLAELETQHHYVADRIRYVSTQIESNRRLEGYLFDGLNQAKTGRFEVSISRPELDVVDKDR
jgi:hypothetical protein